MVGDNITNAIYILASLLNNTHNINDTFTVAREKTFKQFPNFTHPSSPVQVPSSSLHSLPTQQSFPLRVKSTSPVPPPDTTTSSLPRVPSIPSLPLPRVRPTSHLTNHLANHIFDASGKKQTLDSLLQGPTKTVWQRSASNEFGRLAQGNLHGVKGTNTIQFINKHDLPPNAKATYASFVCDYKPFKAEKHRVRMVVGGNRLDYHEDAGAPAASLLETKILLNSVISDAHRGARFMTCDLKDFFLATPMEKPEFMKIPISSIPQDIIDQYNLNRLRTSSNQIYIKIVKGMYGLKQAAVLAYKNLVRNLSNYDYEPIPHTVGLWRHKTRNIRFCLCVDDFGIKFFDPQDAHHLLASLSKHYKLSTDWNGNQFCGLRLDWDYRNNHVDVSMPSYIPNLLDKLNHKPNIPQYSPHPIAPFQPSRPGQRQYAPEPDTSSPLNKKLTTKVQSIVGSLLYYARAIDSSLLPALNTISTYQSAPTENTLRMCHRLLDYVATYPTSRLRYYANNMILDVHSDAAYLVAPKARSRIAGFFKLGTNETVQTTCPILVECKTLRHVVASSAEAEVAGVFHNAQISLPIRHLLSSLGHPQPPTVITTDNTTVQSFANANLTQKRSKSWDMRFYWLRDKECQKSFKIVWKSAITNLADYFTKHFSATYHRQIRSKYILDTNAPVLQGCVSPS